MSLKTLFFVQPYVLKREKLVAAGALTFVEAREALCEGAALARRRAGVLVLSQSYDPARQNLSRPVVLRVYGNVPEEWLEGRKAA